MSQNAQEGKTATFTCKVKGQPMPNVMWEKESVLITPSQKYKTTCIQNEHTLTVYDIDQNDDGDYVCHLHSTVGSTSHPCHLQVSGCPRKAEAVNILKSRLSHLQARESQSPPATTNPSRGKKLLPAAPEPRGQFSQYRQQVLDDSGVITVLSSKSLTVHSPFAPTISSVARMRVPPSNTNVVHQPNVQTYSHAKLHQHSSDHHDSHGVDSSHHHDPHGRESSHHHNPHGREGSHHHDPHGRESSHHHDPHGRESSLHYDPHGRNSNRIQHTYSEKTKALIVPPDEKSSQSAFDEQQNSVYKAEIRLATNVTHSTHHEGNEKQNTQEQSPKHTNAKEMERKRDVLKSEEIVVEYRSVLKRGEKTPPPSEKSIQPKSNVDFREVLSKAKSHEKPEYDFENANMKGGLLGSELRNLQITRNSRNVLSRSGEFTPANPGTSTWSSTSNGGSQTHRSFGITRGKAVNNLGLKSVNKALGAMDVPAAPLSSEPTHSLRHSRWRDSKAPQYSPSSSLPSEHKQLTTDSDTPGNAETVEKVKETQHSRVTESKGLSEMPNKFEDSESEHIEILKPVYSKSLPSEVSTCQRFDTTGVIAAQRKDIQQNSRPTNMFTPTEKPFSVTVQIPSSTNQGRPAPGRLSVASNDSNRYKFGTEQQSQGFYSGLEAPTEEVASGSDQISVSVDPNNLKNAEPIGIVGSDNGEIKEQPCSMGSPSSNGEQLQSSVKSVRTEEQVQLVSSELNGSHNEKETPKVSYIVFSPQLPSTIQDSPVQPGILTLSSKTSSDSMLSSPLSQMQEKRKVSVREHLMSENSDQGSHGDGDDVFIPSTTPEGSFQSDVRRSSLKTVGSVFAWEKYDDNNDTTNFPRADMSSSSRSNLSEGSTNDSIPEKAYRSSRTRFSEDVLSSSEKPKRSACMDLPSADTGLKSASMTSTSSHKSTSSLTSDPADFRSVKLKPAATKSSAKGNLKNSKFMSQSNESLFTDVKLKHVPRPDEGTKSHISSNAAEIRSKSKSSDLTHLFEGKSLQISPRVAKVHPNTARETSTVSHYPKKTAPQDATARFYEAKKAFSSSPNRANEIKYSKPNTASSLTKSKVRTADIRKVGEYKDKPSGSPSHVDQSLKTSMEISVTPKPDNATSESEQTRAKSKDESSGLSHITVSDDKDSHIPGLLSGPNDSVSKSESFTEKFQQWKAHEEKAENVRTRKDLGEVGKSHSNIALMQGKSGSNLNSVPEWVKQKAVNKRHSLQIDKASTLPMSYRHNFEQSERRARINDNKDKPQTPRRFKRDAKDVLNKTLDAPLHKGKEEEDKPEWANRKPLKNIEEKIKSKAKSKPETEDAKPEWVKIKSPRELKYVETSEEKAKFMPKFEFGGSPRNNHKGLEAVSAAALFKDSEIAENPTGEKVQPDSETNVLSLSVKDTTSGKVKTELDRDENVVTSTGLSGKTSDYSDLSPAQRQGESKNVITETSESAATTATTMEMATDPSYADFSSEFTAVSVSTHTTPSSVAQISNAVEKQQSISGEVPSCILSVSESENPSVTTHTPAVTVDSRYTESKSNLNDSSSSVQTQRNNVSVKSDHESHTDAKSKIDSAPAGGQPPSKGVNIRPSWKKSKSLRHIPIYPINDNELSPRYEPFRPTLDDSESIKSTTSVSSSSSDGSTLTNDSGYPKDLSKEDDNLQDPTETTSSVAKEENTYRESHTTIKTDHKAYNTTQRSVFHEDTEHFEEGQKRTLQDSKDLGLFREKLRETWQEHKDHDTTEQMYMKRRNGHDGEVASKHRQVDTTANISVTTKSENNTENSSSRFSRRLKNQGTPYHTPQTSELSTDSGYVGEKELSFDCGYNGDKIRDLKDDDLEDKGKTESDKKDVSEYSRDWSRRLANENKRSQITELAEPSREFSPSRTRTRRQRETGTDVYSARDSALSRDLPTRVRDRGQKHHVLEDSTSKSLIPSEVTQVPSERQGTRDKYLSNLGDSSSIVPSHDKINNAKINESTSSNELSVSLTKHRYTVRQSQAKDTGLNDMSDNAKNCRRAPFNNNDIVNSEPLTHESGLSSKANETYSERGRRKSQYSERTKDRFSHVSSEPEATESDHTNEKQMQKLTSKESDHNNVSSLRKDENNLEEKPPATRPSDLDLIPNWRSQRSRLKVTTDEKRVSSTVHKGDGPSCATARVGLNLSQKETDMEKVDPPSTSTRTAIAKANGTSAPTKTTTQSDSTSFSPPSFPTPLADTTVLYGSKAILKCQVAGYPKPEVQWLLNNTPVEPSKNTEISYSEDNVAQLTILETFTDNVGDYTCFARNRRGRLSTHCTLSLEASNKSEGRAFEGPVSVLPRIVNLTPKAVSLVRGSSLKLTLNFVGEPKPVVKWMQGGKELVSDGRVDIKTERNTSSLTIESVRQSDVGKMSVCVSNSLGSDQTSANISIEDVPEAPVGKPHIYDVGRTSVALSWCGPASRDESHVTYYIIEAKTRQQKSWDVIVPQCKELSYHIFDLKPTTTYQFRVRAANKHGLGAPSEPSEKVITTDPFRSPIDDESEDDLPFEPREVSVNVKDKFEDFYQLDNEVGKGKFGVVYKCKHKTDGKVWAAKIVKCREKDKEAIRQEVEIMNRLRHPKLLMLYEAYESPRQMVLVMEYVGAGELFERVIGEDFVLTERDCVHFLRQICEGVSYMHCNNVLHLDLKPENILCMAETSNRIKIIDFGLARVYKTGESVKVLLGTPEFIAPEVINYDEIDFNTDMWSIGVICYVLLSGLSPFLGDNDPETLANVTSGEFDFDDEAFDEISEQAKDFISKLLVKKKEKRMSTQDCLAHPWLNQDETDGMRYKRLNTERLKRFMVRRKWLKTGNAVLAVSRLLKSSSLSSFTFNHSSSDDATPSPTSTLQYPNLDQTTEEEEEDDENENDPGSKLESDSNEQENLKNNLISAKDNESTTKNSGSDLSKLDSAQESLETGGCNSEEREHWKDSNSNSADRVSELVTDQNYNQVIHSTVENLAENCDNSFQNTTTGTNQMSSSSSSSSPSLPHSSQVSYKTDTQQSLINTSSSSSNKAPVFTKPMRSCKACAGDVARFDVTVTGDPISTVRWFCDGEELQADSRHSMESNKKTGSFSLIIRSIEEDDEGEYVCQAENSQGEITCAAELTVLDI